MTLLQLKGLVDFRYARESAKLKQTVTLLEAGEFSLYYQTILQEILTELSINELTQDIVISEVTTYTDYALNSTYGSLRNFELIFTGEEAGLSRLSLTPMEEMPTVGDDLTSGTPNRIAIFPKNDGLYYVYLYPLSAFAGTLRIRYKVIGDITEGKGNGSPLTSNVPIPPQYKNLLLVGILSMLLPEFRDEYRYMLDNMQLHNAVPSKGHTEYNLGGYE